MLCVEKQFSDLLAQYTDLEEINVGSTAIKNIQENSKKGVNLINKTTKVDCLDLSTSLYDTLIWICVTQDSF